MDAHERRALEKKLASIEEQLARMPRQDPWYTARRNRLKDQKAELEQTLGQLLPTAEFSSKRA